MTTLPDLYAAFLRDGHKMADNVITLRRWFHRHPEIGHEEYQTTRRLKKELLRLGLTIVDGYAETGLWAELDTGRPGPVVAVRADIDALPIAEETGLPYASKYEGFSHACGHDVHMAVLIGAARLLSRHAKKLRGRIKFICQPAEEVPPGGAIPLIAAGVLKNPKVDVILSLHDDPMLPVGSIGLRDGVTMAATFDFDLKITGRTGHAALPHKAVDAINIAAQIITGLQQVVSRMVDPMEPVALSIGTIRGGTARNGIAGEVYLRATARSLNPGLSKKLPALIKKTAVGIGRGLGGKVEFIPVADYPFFSCDARVNAVIAEAYKALYPRGKIHEVPQVLGGEDFACYMEKVPGAMFRLGVGNKKIGADKPWHHAAFTIDEDAIPVGYITMAAAVANVLSTWKGPRR